MLRRSSVVVGTALVGLLLAAFVPSGTVQAVGEPEVRALWVDSFNPGLRSPEEIDALIERAKQGNFNTIMAQVRRNAQSLYAHSLEGWVENYAPPEGFDPLHDLLEKAHRNHIEVHAWVNIGPVYSGNPNVTTASFPCKVPCDPNHVFNLHGLGSAEEENWLTRNHPSFLNGTIGNPDFLGQRASAGTWFMDLGHPAAAQYTIGVLMHLFRHYRVDGIHLDYIRFPEMPIASPRPTGVSLAFATGYNPTSVARFNEAYDRTPGTLPDPWDASWSDWRREQVRSFVRRLYLEMASIRPRAKLSASLITFYRGPNAVEPRTFQQTEAYYRVFQDWDGWMQEGILDLAVPMIYKSQHLASHVTQFREWIEFTKEAQYERHGILGLGAYMNSLENTIVQIAEGRAPSASGALSRGFNFFSYNATNGAIPNVPVRERDEFFRAMSEDGAYATEAPFSSPAHPPAMMWKIHPRRGHLLAQIIDRDGRPADGAHVLIQKMGRRPHHDGTGETEQIEQYADGNGYIGGVDLEPGAYRLVIETPDAPERMTMPVPVVPGRVTRFAIHLGHRWHGLRLRAPLVFGARAQAESLTEDASPLEDWRGREPVPDDLRDPRPSTNPN